MKYRAPNTSGFRPKKSLGQHFLHDLRIINRIVSCAGFLDSDLVVEIGPGKGALTMSLARSVGHVVAIEKDIRLVNLLDKKLKREKIENVTLINHDILKWDFREIKPPLSSKIEVIGNLPYNISTPFLEKLIDNRTIIDRAVLMFQLEIGQRLTSLPGTKAYGAMTVLVQYHAHAKCLLEVSNESFSPKPKVDSMVLELDFQKPHSRRAINENNFRQVVKGAFSHRRKTLVNSLKHFYPLLDRDVIVRGIENCGIEPGTRAETLSIDDFISLAEALSGSLRNLG